MIIIILGLMVSLGYTFIGMTNQRQALSRQSAEAARQALAKNYAQTGVQLAIQRFQYNNDWRGPETIKRDKGSLKISLTKNDTLITITSTANIDQIKQTTKATFDISEKEQLVPNFSSSLGIGTDNFSFDLGGSAVVDGTDDTGKCGDAPGVSVINETAKEIVGTNSQIDGDPEDRAAIDDSLNFQKYSDLISRLEDEPETQYLSGSYEGDLGTKNDPGIFFIEEDTKLTGEQEEGYGVMVIRQGGEFDYEGDLSVKGNFTFNGLVIFENAYELDARGTPTFNGSVVVGSTNDTSITIDISGNVALNYDCTAKSYAEQATYDALNPDRIYRKTNMYE